MTESLKDHNWEGKTLIVLVILGILFGIFPIFESKNKKVEADLAQFSFEEISQNLSTIQENSLLAVANPFSSDSQVQTIRVVVSAYSSTEDQTDSNPFITAAGTYVREGIVATNILPFGTKIKIPKIYGDKIFVVEDRMNPRKKYHIDIWFPTREIALEFGIKETEALILLD